MLGRKGITEITHGASAIESMEKSTSKAALGDGNPLMTSFMTTSVWFTSVIELQRVRLNISVAQQPHLKPSGSVNI